jgi:hypothetical protein
MRFSGLRPTRQPQINGLTRKRHFREVLLRPMWLIILAAWTVFSFAADFRDNFLAPELKAAWETRVVLGWLPQWDWHVWLIGVLSIVVVAMFESSFRMRRSDIALLQKWVGNGAFHAEFLRLYNRGRRLSSDCDEFPTIPLPEAETVKWVNDTEAFLLTRTPEPLNDLYAAMFHEDPRLTKPLGVFGETAQAQLRYKIDCHKYQLNKIMNSLTMMRLSGVANQFGPETLPSSLTASQNPTQ